MTHETIRESHRLEYVKLLFRISKAMALPIDERRRWSGQILELARLASEERARWLRVTPQWAEARHGKVIDLARGIAAMEPSDRARFDAVVADLGATVVGVTDAA